MASSKAAHEGEHFGQIPPPLSVTIKAILERYPDGQIFKELIQNADDAGARTVQFFLDSRQHGKSSLVKPEIARFQGPALLAYNDAQFTADDWKGIRNLQQSGKAEDPFKVGKFGIGFNSVYHITDFPSIISGPKLAYLEPQEKIWEGKSGRLFEIAGISDLPDTFSPFEGICEFTASKGSYPSTLFRFPLRTTPSKLSDNVYSIQQLRELLEALKEEAKFLLLFLRSVDNIEVHEKNERGSSLLFKVSIQERDMVRSKRMEFMDQLKASHATQSFSISTIISFLADFHVEVRDQSSPQPVLSHWLVSTEVGSTDAEVLRLASKQKTFPWVGTALELKDSPRATVSPGGRIFCFLPMPVEASSPYPVHINGTFGLNDDRRTLKWPGIERRNDPTAQWNTELIGKLLPSCYYHLIMSAKQHLQPQKFYDALPDVNLPRGSFWIDLLRPLFQLLLSQAVVWTERKEALQLVGRWIRPCEGVFIPQGAKVPSVVYDALSSCNVQLVKLPPKFWSILSFHGMFIREVNPNFTKAQLRLNPHSYTSTESAGKIEILKYCLSDNSYNDLQGLQLLPLADQVNFVAFSSKTSFVQISHYLCTQKCPAFLLPNQEGILVDVHDDSDLHSSLIEVAKSGKTQLKELTAADVACLLPQSMPQEWRHQNIVSLPHFKLPSDWIEKFWNWVHNESLHFFKGQLIVPVQPAGVPPGSLLVVRLNQPSPVVYIPSAVVCSPQLLSALSKLKVMCSEQVVFPYVYHRELMDFLTSFNTNGVLDAIYSSSGHHSQVSLNGEEANSMRTFLSSPSLSVDGKRLQVLKSLPIFTTMANSGSQLYSVSRAASTSVVKRAVREPDNFVLSPPCIPPNLFIFSNTYTQSQLLHRLVSAESNIDFLLNYLFPLIERGQFPQDLLDRAMEEVLEAIPVLRRRVSIRKISQFFSALGSLPFLKTGSQGHFHSPKELYDPSNPELLELYKGEPVFPIAPFDKGKVLKYLRECNLRQSVQQQEIINIITSIALPQNAHPQMADGVKVSRAKAVLRYLAGCDRNQLKVNVTIPFMRGSYTFSSALQQLATSRSWLPVCSTPPENYPSCIEWKGRPFSSHFVSKSSCTVVLSSQNAATLPLVVGSQVYTVETQLPKEVASLSSTDTASQVGHVLEHFKLLIDNFAAVPNKAMSHIVNLVYKFLQLAKQSGFHTQLQRLKSFDNWVWFNNQHDFVSPAFVAAKQNPTFRRSLEPYIFILPDKLAVHIKLFLGYGMTQQVTEAQIISVLERIKSSDPAQLNPGEAWDIVMSILNWLTDNGDREVSLPPGSTLYVPIQSQSATPELAEADEVVYTDNDFLKNYLASVDTGESYTFVHSKVHPKLAHCLGLSPLSDILDITEDTFEDAGQYEPLTVRLKNILKDYKDGLTIIKELLQNADDAEATEVNICYDARTHDVSTKALFFPGMADSHGPALVVHNNAVFSGEDFDNITKLAGATKESKPLKIGKFGIGFCSVYHITDIPSFVSDNTLCIFDPTLSHLRKEIKNPARPGKKVKFSSKFIAASNQLAPYKGLYGFKPGESYEGTMFRFPFRTSASELSGTIYSEAVCNELMSSINNNASKLLLFLHKVNKITFSRIRQGEQAPIMLLKVTRTPKEIATLLPRITSHNVESSDISLDRSYQQQWLVASSMETVMCKHATASVASLISTKQAKEVEGEVFCFLPLAVKTGLPVHISGNFAVMNNRRGIWTSDGESEKSFEVKWNEELMSTVVPSAYHLLLSALQTMEEQGELDNYAFYSLWPVEQKLEIHNPWNFLISKLYSLIQSSSLFHSTSTQQWLTVEKSKFLESGILSVSSSNPNTPQCVLEAVERLELPIVDLPSDYHTHLDLSSSTVSEEEFVELFFESVNTLDDVFVRNKVLCFMFEVYATELDGYSPRKDYLNAMLMDHPCVPCIPDGTTLRKCSDVVDPIASFASLFDPEESMLPISEFSDKQLVRTALRDLGMLSKYAPWHLLTERARTITREYQTDKTKALTKVQLILECVEVTSNSDPCKESNPLSEIPFLPVLPVPEGYPLPWHGKSHTLYCGKNLVLKGQTARYSFTPSNQTINIAGSQVAIVNEEPPRNGGCGYISHTTRKFLQIRPTPSVTEVIDHLKCLITVFESKKSSPSVELVKWSDRICRQTYQFLNSALSEEASVITELQSCSCIWTGRVFLSPKVVAIDWSVENGPYLYRIPSELSNKKDLVEALGINKKFTTEEIVQALHRMRDDFQDEPIGEDCKNVLQKVIHELYDRFEAKQLEDISNVVLPDASCVMRQASQLAFNDAPWCKPDEEHRFVHDMVNRVLALKLGVKPVRSKMLEKYTSVSFFNGTEFGQREELTRRIQNILREYPFDVTVLKELLQNADDAKAKKMYVILDKRTHSKQGILSDEWSALQGPALLVWNDSTFSEKDLEGIQRLGLGSKRSESESIGQYGIGFNVVYHLTDCPSFITGGDTLCIFDPHCRYVPGADRLSPGRRFDVSAGFWDDFPGLRSTFLRENLAKIPQELLGGSLFRFPLRHTRELVKSSEIVDHSVSSSSKPLTASVMHRNIGKWASEMKQALLFLNHVTEFQFLVIEENNNHFTTEYRFEVHIDDYAQDSRELLHDQISAFTQPRGSEPCVQRYPLSITEVQPNYRGKKTEKWLIQQGVGDIGDSDDPPHWLYIDRVKPRHGIATPLTASKDDSSIKRQGGSTTTASASGSASSTSQEGSKKSFLGHVFCFLPLPIKSNLPVHVNGHFILDSSRRALWKATQPGHVDDRTKWNEDLLNAIASSYANLLIHAREYFLPKQSTAKSALHCSISDYYSMFPQLSDSSSGEDRPVECWLKLAEDVYRKLAYLNRPILASIKNLDVSPAANTSRTHTKCFVEWHEVNCADEPATQAYFFKPVPASKEVHSNQLKNILHHLGMSLTCAPLKIRNNFKKVDVEIPATDPESVFQYFTSFFQLAGDPCEILNTPFKAVTDFRAFLQYILKKSDSENIVDIGCFEFPQDPFGHPLLLTADSKLRKFQKVIKSDFSFLFPHSQDQFLHPELLNLSLKSSYFIETEDCENDSSIVSNLIVKTLPHTLRQRRVRSVSQHIKQEFLKKLWQCLENDGIFNAQISYILRDWALLPTTDDSLFSCPSSDCLLPVIQPCLEYDTDMHIPECGTEYKPIFQALRHLGMPLLVSGIISNTSTANQFCPMLANHESILKNLYYLSKEVNITPLLQNDTLRILVEYLRKINFKQYSEYKDYLFSLPLFEDVDGNMNSLVDNTVHVWPHTMCSAGRKKWLLGKKIVFLQPRLDSLWHRLGSYEELGVEVIQAESVYVQYIFPEFDKLSEQERYEHLRHIRDDMFDVAESQAQTRKHRNKSVASQFIQALKKLHCIGRDSLQCISEFSDHRLKIFTTFPQFFQFLPHSFQEDNQHEKWMKFFSKLGLKMSLTQHEYIRCCESTAHGKQHDVKKSSTVLLQYLLPSDCKPKLPLDSDFLSQISQIPFVYTEQLPELSWISPSCSSSEGKTTLQGAADIRHSELLWLVQPIIQLPPWTSINYPEELKILDVTVTPSVNDVVANIVSISKTRFADSSLFNTYPSECCKPKKPVSCESVMQILLKNFDYLNSHLKELTVDHFKRLSGACFIPVYANLSDVFNEDFVVLVKPQHVVLSSSAQDFFPFVHRLPTKIHSVITLLEKTGVSSNMDLKHFQIVLQAIFNQSRMDEVNPNMKAIVVRAVKELDASLKKLKSNSKGVFQTDVETALCPLYLPTTEGKLHLSSSLLCRNTESYVNIEVSLSDTNLFLLHLPQPIYELSEVEFCSLLPRSLRPKMMSECCLQVLPDDADPIKDSQLTSILRENLSQPSLLQTLTLMIRHFTEDEELLKKCKPVLAKFFEGLIIRPVKKLKPTVMFKAVEPPLEIGKAIVNCHIKKHSDDLDTSVTLSVDSHLVPNQDIIALQHLVQYIISILRPLCSTATETSLEKLSTPFLTALKAESSEQQTDALLESGITPSTEMIFEAGVKPRLGKQIPKSWHHLLDQNISNIFHCNEWVGYQEDIEGESNAVYTFAQVICPILTGETEISLATVMEYKIYTREDDEEGTKVSALQIFKFASRNESQSSDEAITTYLGQTDEGEVSREERRDELIEAKRNLCKELTVIWKLPDNERKQGIKRLYVKWHPDKNFSNTAFAEDIFKFLLCQIDRLEQNLPLEDENITQSTTPQEQGASSQTSSSQWRSYYPQWDETVFHHQHSRQSEQHYRKQGGGGRGGWRTSASASTNIYENFPQSLPDQEEGKRWVKQARIDYEVLCVVYERVCSCPVYAGHVCFMAHQVAEKALKGGKYAVCGLGVNSLMNHSLTDHAYALQAVKPLKDGLPRLTDHGYDLQAVKKLEEILGRLSSLSSPLEPYYLNTRYPNRVSLPQIPSDKFNSIDADEAKHNAEEILELMENIVKNAHTFNAH